MPFRKRKLVAKNIAFTYLIVATAADACAVDVPADIHANTRRHAYFGDLHLHTSFSFDAYLFFGAQADPEEAYRFARGEPGRYLEEEMTRSTPALDFMAVTDHAEWIGVMNSLEDPESTLSRSDLSSGLRKKSSAALAKLGAWPSSVNPQSGVDTEEIAKSTWQRVVASANRHYRPGTFTTFIGYEWTAMPSGHHLHRNVLFRGDGAPIPFTAFDSMKPEDLWKYLESIRRLGYEALAIAHNPNLSGGQMFDWLDSEGRKIDGVYAARRAENEPLVEISQNKGQSETHPALSRNDEFSNFETLNQYAGAPVGGEAGGRYARDGIGRGLTISQYAGGQNPFKYGFVGGSDFHNGLSDSAERAYAGFQGAIDPTKRLPSVDAWVQGLAGEATDSQTLRTFLTEDMYEPGSGSLTGVWAERNTRESIFDALRRKEAFATSGTRIKVRFFGGWHYDYNQLFKARDWAEAAYSTGVSMGGDLPRSPVAGQRPRFVVWAVKDPNGANLDRLQIVKVWIEQGKNLEKVFDVALSDGRKVDPISGKATPVGSTVDRRNASYANTIGAVQLAAVWEDSVFDAKSPAAYYLRALEIPTPRWSTIVAARRKQPLPDGVPAEIQERAWSSPIWYVPE